MSDFTESMGPEELAQWEAFVDAARTEALGKIRDSAVVMNLAPRAEPDIKYAVELGLTIMLDKPLLVVVMPGRPVPPKLRAVADEVVEADLDTEAGRERAQASAQALAERLGGDDG